MSTDEVARPRLRLLLNSSGLLLTLIAATALRFWNLGRLSFWYDEVVTMRLAEAPSLAALFKLLFQIDATRAPLHPLILQDWLALFGDSEASARSLSVVFGVATVALLYFLGRNAFDESTGLWSAFLAAFSPLLVYYSRETRMYALLTLIATLCWTMLFWNRRAPSRWKTFAYAVCLVAMLFTHPLGLLMLGTLGLASALDVRAFYGSWKAWSAVHLGVLIVTAPWLRFYFDHPPEFLSGRLPIKFLLATPIGFLGGDSTVYVVILALIAFGLYKRRIMDLSWLASGLRAINRPSGAPSTAGGEGNPAFDSHETQLQSAPTTREWVASACLILWLALPPMILYVYSMVASPIFGPARYTLFCAPAYLVLIAQALGRIPPLSRWTVGLGLACLAFASLRTMIYDPPNTRMDWRSFTRALGTNRPRWMTTFIMTASNDEPCFELETARYYLARTRTLSVVPFDESEIAALRDQPRREVYLFVGATSDHKLSTSLEERLRPIVKGVHRYQAGTLLVYHFESPEFRPGPPPAPAPAAPARPVPD